MWLIGASLSEPHTSMTALRKCVCIYACLDRPLTVNFKWAHSNISHPCRSDRHTLQLSLSYENKHEGYCQTVGLAWRRARAKTTSVKCVGSTHGNLFSELWYMIATNHGRSRVTPVRQAASDRECTVVRLASGKRLAWPLIHSRDSFASSWFNWET